MNKQIPQDKKESQRKIWKAIVTDDAGHDEICMGKSFNDVWEGVAMVENFDIPTTVCKVYHWCYAFWPNQKRYEEKVSRGMHGYWFLVEVLYGNEDQVLIEQMTKYNEEEKVSHE